MLRSLFLILLIVLPVSPGFAQTGKWQEAKSTHFIVHYISAPEDFINRLAGYAEDYYNRIADELGFRRFDFWLWDNRAHIYVYDDTREYQKATGQPAWSGGCAKIQDKTIYTFLDAPQFFENILPHEMGHIIFREFVGFNNHAVPLWLDEGVASYEERLKRTQAAMVIKKAIAAGSFMGLERLSAFNPQLSQDTAAVSIFYSESVSIVEYLVNKFGSDNFISFCQQLRDKKDLQRAISSVYPFEKINDLGQAWQNSLANG